MVSGFSCHLSPLPHPCLYSLIRLYYPYPCFTPAQGGIVEPEESTCLRKVNILSFPSTFMLAFA